MDRFYSSFNLHSKIIFLIDLDEIHHLKDVLRLKVGDTVIAFNGEGLEAKTEIVAIDRKSVQLQIKNIVEFKKDPPRIILACAVPKRGKFEMIIEKATELGVDEIIPLLTQRTEVVVKDELRVNRKIDRFQTVAMNASKQSKRLTIPKIYGLTKFDDAINRLKASSVIFIPSLIGDRKNLIDEIRRVGRPNEVAFLIGPEGDFTSQEYAFAFEQGCLGVSLGPTVLKVETAAFCALSCANVYYFS